MGKVFITPRSLYNLTGTHLHSGRPRAPKRPVVHAQAAVIQDSTPCCVFRVDELARLILVSHLIPASQKGAVNLARTYWHLEEPVLSTLWCAHSPLHAILRVLPGETLKYDCIWHSGAVCGLGLPSGNRTLKLRVIPVQKNPITSSVVWNKVHREASRAHRLSLDRRPAIGGEPIHTLRLNSPMGWMVPNVTRITLAYCEVQPPIC